MLDRLRSFFSRWSPFEWAFLFGLVLPVGALMLTLKALRVADYPFVEGFASSAALLHSDLFFLIGLTIAGIGALTLARGPRLRLLIFTVFQVLCILLASVEVAVDNFYRSTGSILDWALIIFAYQRFEETRELVATEVTTTHIWMLVGAVSAALIVPQVMLFVLRRWLDRGEVEEIVDGEVEGATQPSDGDASGRARSRLLGGRQSLAAIALAGLMFVLSVVPVWEVSKLAMASQSTVSLIESAVDTYTLQAASGGAREPLLDTKLEPRVEPTERRNVVVILMESTRASATTPYNSEMETTPYLEELSKNSIMAERAYAVVPHTSKALVASLCGIEPRLNLPISEALPGGIPAKCMAKLLSEQGYGTAFFQSATKTFESRPQLVRNMGYQDFFPLEKLDKKGFAKANYFGREDNVMLEPSKEWLVEQKKSGKPIFLTYLTLTPHHHYLAPRRYGRHKFTDVETKYFNRYLNAVHYVDHFVENVIEMFREVGLYEDTIFVVVGDHGEGFGEHGRNQHDNTIYEEGIRIPFFIHDPQRFQEGVRVDELVSQIDILPTALELAGFDIVGGVYPGTHVLRAPADRVVRSHCWYERRCMASIRGHVKFIHHFNRQPDEAFDLLADPLEKKNIARSRSLALVDRLERLERWRNDVIALHRAHIEERLEEYVTDEKPEIAHELDISYGDYVRLVGYDAPESAKPGEQVEVTYFFKVDEELPGGYKLFVHGEGSRRMRNMDHDPVQGLLPPDEWKEGKYIRDIHKFKIPRRMREDSFDLYVGIYHKKKGRLETTRGGEPVDEDRPLVVSIPIER